MSLSLIKKILFCMVMPGTLSFFPGINMAEARTGEQMFRAKKFTSGNGLSHDNIFWITQDKTGFLWIATWDGVSRFDGNEFRNYFHQPGEINTIPFFAVDKITVDSANNVWVGGLTRYDRANDRFVKDSLFPGLESRFIDMEGGPDGKLWFLLKDGFLRVDYPSKHSAEFSFFPDEEFRQLKTDNKNFQMCVDNTGGLWLAVNSKSSYDYSIIKADFNKDSGVVLKNYGFLPISMGTEKLAANVLIYFNACVSPSGATWLFTKFGIFRLDSLSGRFRFSDKQVNLHNVTGNYWYRWMDEKTGLNLMNNSARKHFQIVPGHGNEITASFIDKDQTIWYADMNLPKENIGLSHCTIIPEYFIHYLTEKDESGKNRLVFPICQGPDGEIWAGTRYSDKLFRITSDGRVIQQSFYDRSIGTNHPRIRSMFRDSSGIWMGCTQNYLVRYDFSSRQFTSFKVFAKDKEGKACDLGLHNILPDHGNLLINGGRGIYRFYPRTGKTELLYFNEVTGSAYCFTKDNGDGYWLGIHENTIVHLDKFLIETGRYKLGNEQNIVEHIQTGDSTDVWVALMGGGLAHFFPETKEVKFYTTANGLTNNTLYSMIRDKRGNLWISTNNGISRFNPLTSTFRNFRIDNGLLIREFNSDSWFQSSDGRIFFGGVGGMIGFHPDSIGEASETGRAVPLIITDLKVSGIPRYFEHAIYEMDSVRLEKGDNNLQISFACLDFNNPEKIKYRYKLAGDHNPWNETDYRNRNINYTNLSPGSYHLLLEATNINGDWARSTSLFIIIPPFYYQTLWFRIAVFLTTGMLSFLIVLLYLRQIKLKARQKQDELRLESLRGQMNPHFIFNSLNSINYFISKNDKYSANHYIADFSRLIRSILHNLSSDYIPLDKELESLSDYLKLEHLRFSDKFTYLLKHDRVDDLNNVLVFPGMVQPFAENAIWHGVRGLEDRIGLIRIEFLPGDSQSLQCIIEDDGVGRKLSEILKSHMPSSVKGIAEKKTLFCPVVDENSFPVLMEYAKKANFGIDVSSHS